MGVHVVAVEGIRTVVPALDLLDAMLAELGLDGSRQSRTRSTPSRAPCRNVLQALGYEAFHAELGEPFTPARMGPSATLAANPAWSWPRCGPATPTGGGIVRPAGVLVVNSPAADAAADRGGQA